MVAVRGRVVAELNVVVEPFTVGRGQKHRRGLDLIYRLKNLEHGPPIMKPGGLRGRPLGLLVVVIQLHEPSRRVRDVVPYKTLHDRALLLGEAKKGKEQVALDGLLVAFADQVEGQFSGADSDAV